MGNQYGQWDTGPFRQPPEPPQRPEFWEWLRMSETQRMQYDAGINAYLMAQQDPDWWALLNDLRVVYINAWAKLGAGDHGSWLDMWDCPWNGSPLLGRLFPPLPPPPLPPEERPDA